jgi:hypothetical protein
MARDWQPDLANWAMYTPWPFTPLFQELGDKVEIFDFEKYNFVTPIMKPEAMDRATLLDRVMHNYRRFYMRKALFHYPWRGTGPARYLLGCLKAFAKAGFQRTFYDLGKVNYWGPQSKKKVDFNFDALPPQATGHDGARAPGHGAAIRLARSTWLCSSARDQQRCRRPHRPLPARPSHPQARPVDHAPAACLGQRRNADCRDWSPQLDLCRRRPL